MADLSSFADEIEQIIKSRVRQKHIVDPRQEPARYAWLLSVERKALEKEIADDEKSERGAWR